MSIWTVRDQVFLRAQGSTRLLVLKLQFPVIDPSTGQPSKVLRGLVRVRWPHMELAILQCSRNLQEWNCDKKHRVTNTAVSHDMSHTLYALIVYEEVAKLGGVPTIDRTNELVDSADGR